MYPEQFCTYCYPTADSFSVLNLDNYLLHIFAYEIMFAKVNNINVFILTHPKAATERNDPTDRGPALSRRTGELKEHSSYQALN